MDREVTYAVFRDYVLDNNIKSRVKSWLDGNARRLSVNFEGVEIYTSISLSHSGDITDYDTNLGPFANQINPLNVQVSSEAPTLDPTQTRVDLSRTKVDLLKFQNPGVNYTSIYSYTGAGKLYGFKMKFNSDRVIVRLRIDGETLFDMDCDDLDYFNAGGGSSNHGEGSQDSWTVWKASGKQFCFRPLYPVNITSSVEIEAKANSNSNSRDMQGYIIDLERN